MLIRIQRNLKLTRLVLLRYLVGDMIVSDLFIRVQILLVRREFGSIAILTIAIFAMGAGIVGLLAERAKTE